MKRRISIVLASVLLMAAGCKDSGTVKDRRAEFRITEKYLLIPIGDKDEVRKMHIEIDGRETGVPMDIRIASGEADYWVPLDVALCQGENVTLRFDEVGQGDRGWREIRQSATFDFDYNEKYRPAFHFSPKHGWMNDPNGMVWLDGEYHLFYQHNPYGSMWGNMHWGHAVTSDFVRWEHLPVAIAPDANGTIFSGSAVIDHENTAGFGKDAMVAIYTYDGPAGQTQGIAYSTDRGRTFTKYEGNPVLSDPTVKDFRDPKVMWHGESSQWIMSLATSQTISFYGSPDLREWTRLSEFGQDIGAHTGVWECPDLFRLRTPDGRTKWVLFVSVGGNSNGGTATQYFIGDFDGREFRADPLPYPLFIDYGRDNYAGVTWSNVPENDGRCLFIGWMSNWDYANDVPTVNFRNAATLPRELRLESNGGHLVLASYPVREVLAMRGTPVAADDVVVEGKTMVDKLLRTNGGEHELEMTFTPRKAARFGFSLVNQEGETVVFTFDTGRGVFSADRRNGGMKDFSEWFAGISEAPLPEADKYTVNLFIDKASVECFVNKGAVVQTNLVFPASPYVSVELFSEDGQTGVSDIKAYPLH